MKYKLPILTCLTIAGLMLICVQNSYLVGPIFSSLNAQPVSDDENKSSVNIGIPVDADGNPMEVTVVDPMEAPTNEDSLLTDPDIILGRAISQMYAESKFQASIRHKINMFDQQLVGSGHYRQFGNGTIKRLRFELKTQVGDKTSSVIQVCDGRHLWSRENLPEGTTLSRVDVRYIRDALEAENSKHGAGRLATNWGANIAMGGLPRLLASLQACFEFEAVTETRFEDVPVWVLLGQWKPEVRDRIMKQFGTGKQIPPHLPNAVRLVLGRDVEYKFIPREIQYLRINSDKTAQPMVSLQLYDITRRVDMNAAQFEYQRGEQVIVDRTQAFLDKYVNQE